MKTIITMLFATLSSASAFMGTNTLRTGVAFTAKRSFSRSTIAMMANPKGVLDLNPSFYAIISKIEY